MTAATEPEPGVNLARELDFTLGGLSLSPSACRVQFDGRDQRIEPRVMEVLVVLARSANHTVTRDDLIGACWGGRIVSDDAVNRVVAQVRQLGRSFEPAPFVLETVPKVSFRLIVEGTGEVRRSGVDKALRRPAVLTAVILLVAAAVAVAGVFAWRARSPTGPIVVAVLPFEDQVGGELGRELADGVPEEVINDLVRVPGLRVTSRVSSFQFRGADKAKAATALKARYLLDGSVQQDGDRITVRASLTDTQKDLTLWSDAYDRPATELLIIQQEIAARVADALEVRLSPDWRKPAETIAPETYRLYLEARDAIRQRRQQNLFYAMGKLEQVVKAEPRFSRAWSALAVARVLAVVGPYDGDAMRRDAEVAARQALALDPRNAEALAALGLIRQSRREWLEADRLYAQALSYAPSQANLVMWKANLDGYVGRRVESERNHRRAYELDPLNRAAVANYLDDALRTGDVKLAAELRAKHRLLGPPPSEPTFEQQIGEARGREDWAGMVRIAKANPDPRYADEDRLLFAAVDALAARKASPELVAEMRAAAAKGDTDLLKILIRLGELDAAADAAVAMAPVIDGENGRPSTVPLFTSAFDPLREDPRFMRVAERYGLIAYWQATGRWPDYCTYQSTRYDCKAEAARAHREALSAARR